MTAKYNYFFEAGSGFFQSTDPLFKVAPSLFKNLFYSTHRLRPQAKTFKQIYLFQHGIDLKIGRIRCAS